MPKSKPTTNTIRTDADALVAAREVCTCSADHDLAYLFSKDSPSWQSCLETMTDDRCDACRAAVVLVAVPAHGSAATWAPLTSEQAAAIDDWLATKAALAEAQVHPWVGDGPTVEEVGGRSLWFWCSWRQAWLRSVWDELCSVRDAAFSEFAWLSVDNGAAAATATHWRRAPGAPVKADRDPGLGSIEAQPPRVVE